MNAHTKEPDQIAALAKELGVVLPPHTTILGVERESGMDDRVRAKLLLSPTAVDQLPVSADQLSRGAGRLGVDRGFWNPNTTPGIHSGQVPLSNGRFLNVGVADGQGDEKIVFLVNHGT